MTRRSSVLAVFALLLAVPGTAQWHWMPPDVNPMGDDTGSFAYSDKYVAMDGHALASPYSSIQLFLILSCDATGGGRALAVDISEQLLSNGHVETVRFRFDDSPAIGVKMMTVRRHFYAVLEQDESLGTSSFNTVFPLMRRHRSVVIEVKTLTAGTAYFRVSLNGFSAMAARLPCAH